MNFFNFSVILSKLCWIKLYAKNNPRIITIITRTPIQYIFKNSPNKIRIIHINKTITIPI